MRMTVRIPEDLKTWLREEAKKEERSVNGQLVHILRQHYEDAVPIVKGVEEQTDNVVGVAQESVEAGELVTIVVQGGMSLPPGSPQTIEKGAK